MKKFLLFVGFWFLVFFIVYKYYIYNSAETDDRGGLEKVAVNYREEVENLAARFDLPSSYLLAVIMLECSGRKNPPPRFEKEIYEKLVNVRERKNSRLENVTHEVIEDASDEAIKNLATSWGPFQLMGYKCTYLGIKIDDLRGSNSVYWGVKWIDLTYGDYLRKKRFKDGFHIHNAGKEYPKNGKPFTYDPKYVENGLRYMKYFERLDSTRKNDKRNIKIYW